MRVFTASKGFDIMEQAAAASDADVKLTALATDACIFLSDPSSGAAEMLEASEPTRGLSIS